jgi:hypothetical protein
MRAFAFHKRIHYNKLLFESQTFLPLSFQVFRANFRLHFPFVRKNDAFIF